MATNDHEAAKLRWDESQMKSSYANVCNVSTSREEVILAFGTQQAADAGLQELTVAITDRVIMNPAVAKQLSMLLETVLQDYESRFGALPDPRVRSE